MGMFRRLLFFFGGMLMNLNVVYSTIFSPEQIADVNGTMSEFVANSVGVESSRTKTYGEDVDGAERDKLTEALNEESRRRKEAEDALKIVDDQVETLCKERELLIGVSQQGGIDFLRSYIDESLTKKLRGYEARKEVDVQDDDLEEDIKFQQAKIQKWKSYIDYLGSHSLVVSSGGTTHSAEYQNQLGRIQNLLDSSPNVKKSTQCSEETKNFLLQQLRIVYPGEDDAELLKKINS